MQRAWFVGIPVCVMALLFSVEGSGQTREQRTPTIAIDSLVGSDSFNLYHVSPAIARQGVGTGRSRRHCARDQRI